MPARINTRGTKRGSQKRSVRKNSVRLGKKRIKKISFGKKKKSMRKKSMRKKRSNGGKNMKGGNESKECKILGLDEKQCNKAKYLEKQLDIFNKKIQNSKIQWIFSEDIKEQLIKNQNTDTIFFLLDLTNKIPYKHSYFYDLYFKGNTINIHPYLYKFSANVSDNITNNYKNIIGAVKDLISLNRPKITLPDAFYTNWRVEEMNDEEKYEKEMLALI